MRPFDVAIKHVDGQYVLELHAFGQYEPGDPRTWSRQPNDPSRESLEIADFHVCDETAWEVAQWDALDLLEIAPQHRDRWLSLVTEALIKAQGVI